MGKPTFVQDVRCRAVERFHIPHIFTYGGSVALVTDFIISKHFGSFLGHQLVYKC